MDFLLAEKSTQSNAVWENLRHVLGRHKVLIVLVLLTTIVSTYGTLQLVAELYETRAGLLAKLGRENMEVPATVERGGVFMTGVRKEELNSEILMLTSRHLLEAVVDKIGPEAFQFEPAPPHTLLQTVKYHIKRGMRWIKSQAQSFLIMTNLKKQLTEREQAILVVERALVVEREKDSDVIGLRLRLPDPGLALRVLENLLQFYYDHRVQVRGGNTEIRKFFDAQVEQYKQQLNDIEGLRELVRTKWHLSAVANQRSLLLERLKDLESQIGANETEQAQVHKQLKSLQVRQKALPDELRRSQVVTHNPSVQSTKERIATLQQERAKLANRYTPESQLMQNIDSELDALKALLAQESLTVTGSTTSELNPLKQSFVQSIEQNNVKLAGLEAGVQRLRLQSAAVAKQLQLLNTGADQLEVIERDHKIAEQDYLAYMKRREEVRIAEELDRHRIANITLLSPPVRPIEPVYPRKLLIMGLSLPLGLLLSIALALLLEYTNDAINTHEDLDSVEGFTYLGTFHR